jgi:hypothetical protein
VAREKAAQGGEQHLVLGTETRLAPLARKDLELMTENQDLDVFGVDCSAC